MRRGTRNVVGQVGKNMRAIVFEPVMDEPSKCAHCGTIFDAATACSSVVCENCYVGN